MRVLVTGGTGFTGPDIVRALLARGHEVTALVHRSTGPFAEGTPGLRFVHGDARDVETLRAACRGQDAVVHLVAIRRAWPKRGITFEGLHTGATRALVEAARAEGVRRFLYMSASGVKSEGTAYQRTKLECEGLVKASGLAWTIFRPTFIIGRAEGSAKGFDEEFADIVRKAPILPSFAGGRFRLQPVARRDVAEAFARAVTADVAHGKTYFLAGPTTLTWNEYLRTLARLLGKRRLLAPVPGWFILALTGLLGRFAWFPATRDELVMLMEGHTGDPSAAERDLGLKWTPHEEALREALGAEPAGGGAPGPSGRAAAGP